MPSPSVSTPRGTRAAVRQRWLELVADYEHSGLTQRAFCEQHRLAVSTFTRWCRRVACERAERPPAFVAVTLTEETGAPSATHLSPTPLRVTLPGGVIVEGLTADNVSVVTALAHAL